LDPYVLISAPELSRTRTVVFISVSGRTQSNIASAKKVKSIAGKTMALTASASSPLTRATEEAVTIPYRYRPRVPGTLSFTLSLVAALKLASVDCSCNFPRLLRLAEVDASALRFSDAGTSYFLGNHASFAAALYAAAKSYEFFGARAQAQLLEEFSHLELFSLRKRDVVNVFSSADPSRAAERLAGALSERGYRSCLVKSRRANKLEGVFHAIFTTQFAVLEKMRSEGRTSPYFLGSRQKLSLSDSMIY